MPQKSINSVTWIKITRFRWDLLIRYPLEVQNRWLLPQNHEHRHVIRLNYHIPFCSLKIKINTVQLGQRFGRILQRCQYTLSNVDIRWRSAWNHEICSSQSKILCMLSVCPAEVSWSCLRLAGHVIPLRWFELHVRSAICSFLGSLDGLLRAQLKPYWFFLLLLHKCPIYATSVSWISHLMI